MKKLLLILLAAASLAGACWYLLAGPHSRKAAPVLLSFDPAAPVPVLTVQPEITAIEHVLNTVGTFLAEDKIEVSPSISGPVAEILVEEGEQVRKGDVLMRLDDTRFKFNHDRAVAEVTQREVDLENQRTSFERQEVLIKTRAISTSDYDLSKTSLRLAEVQLVVARAALALETKNLTDTKITAPISGSISARRISEGEYVKTGDPVYDLVSTTPLKLRFTLPERHAAAIRTGQKVELTVRATGDRKFNGEIYFINPIVNPEALTLEIKALVDNKEGILRPGYFAQVSIVTGANPEAILIPQEAIVIRDNARVAFVAKDGRAERRSLQLGERRHSLVEVLEGIQPGDSIITSGQFQLSDGKAVIAATAP